MHKLLQDARVKLATVASDVMGVSGRRMLEALVAGTTDPEVLAELAKTRLQTKLPELPSKRRSGRRVRPGICARSTGGCGAAAAINER